MVTVYEAIFIVETTLPDEQMQAVVNKYSGIITANGGTILDIDRWDPRRLAYEIKGKREGIYFIVNFESEPAAKNELDRIFRISDDVLRHMIVKQDKRADKYPSRTRSVEVERREREQAARQAERAAATAPAPVTDLSAPPTGYAPSAGGRVDSVDLPDDTDADGPETSGDE